MPCLCPRLALPPMEHGSRPRTHRSVARPSPARTSPAHLLSCAALRWQSLSHANQAKPSQDTTVSEVGACAVEKQEQLVQKEPEEICGVTFGDPRGGELLPRACLACPSALSHCCRRARFAGYVDTVSLLTRDYKDTIDTTPLLDHPLTSLGNDDPAPPAPLSAPRPRRPRSQSGRRRARECSPACAAPASQARTRSSWISPTLQCVPNL